jgi:adsorption protein B
MDFMILAAAGTSGHWGDLGFYLWLSFRYLFIALLFVYVISGLDDLLLDMTHYVRVVFRLIFRRKLIKPVTREQLDSVTEKPGVIIIPAWDESNVISRMLLNTASTLLYRNYHIFVGTYPNDEATKLEVEKVREVFPNIEVVVTPANGPTNKADCLNWVYQGILLYEKEHNTRFEIFLFHDAEDVVHPLSMKFYNYLVPRFHFVQIPVFPFEQNWKSFAAGCYMDEFAENHTKDMRARELLSSAIPSAGVGTALSREAIDYMARHRRNQIFDIGSVTEDYMMGMLLRDMPGKKIFLQQWIERTVKRPNRFTGGVHEEKIREPVATREFFPNSFSAAVRQKSRWIMGIALQGWKAGWSRSLGLNYCLYRDRKSVFTNLLVIVGYIVVLYVLLGWLVAAWRPELAVPPLVTTDEPYYQLLKVVLALFVWRLLNRMYAVWQIYGAGQAFLSVPRFFYGNFLNFFATWMAIKRYVRARVTGKVPEWGKTSHAYPTVDQLRAFRRKLGDLLLERRLITTAQLEAAIAHQKATGRKLGEVLVEMGALWEEDLVAALAHQRNEKSVELDPHGTPPALLQLVPRPIAEKYRVFPLAERDGALVLAADGIDEQKARELEALLKRPVKLEWTSAADIHFAISRAYRAAEKSGTPESAAQRLGDRLLEMKLVAPDDLHRALRKQKRTNQMLGEVLVDMKLLTPGQLNEVLKEL